MGVKLNELLHRHGGRITIQILVQAGLTEERAVHVLQSLWHSGELSPMTTSFFVRPNADGSVPVYERPKPSASSKNLVRSAVDRAMTTREVQEKAGLSLTVVRRVLEELVADGSLYQRTASVGGIYGKKPTLWGPTRQSLSELDDALIEAYYDKQAEKLKARKAAKAKGPASKKPADSEQPVAANVQPSESYEAYVKEMREAGMPKADRLTRKEWERDPV